MRAVWIALGACLVIASPGFAQAPFQALPQITPEMVRPPASMLATCDGSDAPAALPEALAKWATVYCTKGGHLFSPNDRYFGMYPGTGMRGNVNASWLDGTKPPAVGDGRFVGISYTKLAPADAKELVDKAEPATKQILTPDLYRVEMTTAKGSKATLLVTDPASEPFWVFQERNGALMKPAFYVTSLAWVNAKKAAPTKQ